jgi:ribosomal protein S18 acetylase RimI-like enzyme
MFGILSLVSLNMYSSVAHPKEYKSYRTTRGEQVAFIWKEPDTLSNEFKAEMLEMFIDTFIAQYRESGSFSESSDAELRNILQEYFAKSISLRFANKKDQYFLYAQANDKVIGFVFWEKLDEQQAYVAELAIAKDYWRQGLGKIFMQSIFAKLPDTKKIVLLTEHENEGAHRFYESLGYKPSNYMHAGYTAEKFRAYEWEQ